jgi:hypothetical protein
MGDVLPILRYLKPHGVVFRPHELRAMSMALDDVCDTLGIRDNNVTREVIAIRIIELARHGECSPTKLRDRLLAEANGGSGC